MASDRVAAIAGTDLRVAARDGEQLLLTLGLPLLFLVFFSQVDVLPTVEEVEPGAEPIDFLAPGIVALALMSVAFVRPAIALGFDRSFGAIKRFAVTPLTVAEFLVAKLAATTVVFVVQLVLITAIGLTLGWRPGLSPLVVLALALGLVAFGALAMVLSSVIDGLASLAVANALYLVLLMLSGLIFDPAVLPDWLRAVAQLLPTTALGSLLRHLFEPSLFSDPGIGPWSVLAAWAMAAPLAAWRLFRWD